MADSGGRGGGGSGRGNSGTNSARRRRGSGGNGGRSTTNTGSEHDSNRINYITVDDGILNRTQHQRQGRSRSAPSLTCRKKHGDAVTESLAEKLGELVLNRSAEAPSKLQTVMNEALRENPQRLQAVLTDETTPCFPQGNLLTAAVVRGNDVAADLLLRYGADPNQKCPSSSTPLILACYNGLPSCVRLLLGLPGTLRGPMAPATRRPPQAADPKLSAPDGRHALIQACRCPKEGAAEVLTAELLKRDWVLAITPDKEEEILPAHAAAASGFPGVLEMLLATKPPKEEETEDCTRAKCRSMQMHWRNAAGRNPLQVAEIKCEADRLHEREQQQQQQQQQQQNVNRSGGGGRNGGSSGGSGNGAAGGGSARRDQRRNTGGNRGGFRAGQYRGRGRGGRGGQGRSQSEQTHSSTSDGTRSEDGDSNAASAEDAVSVTTVVSEVEGGDGGAEVVREREKKAPQQDERRVKGGWGCVVVLAAAAGVMDSVYGTSGVKNDPVRHRILAHFGLHRVLEDIRIQAEKVEFAEETGGNVEELVTDYTVATMGYLSSMYKAVVKPSRTSPSQQSTAGQLLKQLIQPRKGYPHCLTDVTMTVVLEIVSNTSANPHVVRHLVLMLTEIADGTSKASSPAMGGAADANRKPAEEPARRDAMIEGGAAASERAYTRADVGTLDLSHDSTKADMLEEEERSRRKKQEADANWEEGLGIHAAPPVHAHGFNTLPCCPGSTVRKRAEEVGDPFKVAPPTGVPPPPFHSQVCLAVWKEVSNCIYRLGKMLLYGLQGQQEGQHGEVLYEREAALFDALWELLFRTLLPHAREAARYLLVPPRDNQSPAQAIMSQLLGKTNNFESLWTGLDDALDVIEGVVGSSEPDRFGALLRGYLVYLHLMDDRLTHFDALVKVVKDNRVDTGVLTGAGAGWARGGRSRGRNPKNILGAIAGEASLGIPEQFKALVVERSSAIEEILDADPAVLENRLSVLLRIEGAVETPQKLDYIVSVMEARAGNGSGKALELSINRMAEPYETVDMAMQQLAAAPPRVMGQAPEIKYVNEPGEGDGPLRELIDILSEVFRTKRTLTADEVAAAASAAAASFSADFPPSPPLKLPSGQPSAEARRCPSGLNPAASPFAVPGLAPALSPNDALKPGALPYTPSATHCAGSSCSSSSSSRYATRGSDDSGSVGSQAAATHVACRGCGDGGRAGLQTAAKPIMLPARPAPTGFWKSFPLFEAYAPDPALVVPCETGPSGRGGVRGVGKTGSAVEREEGESRLRFFRAAGRVIALSLVTSAPLGLALPDAAWAILLGLNPTWEDCCGRDEAYKKSMQSVLDHKFGQGDDGNGLELFFTVSEKGPDGKMVDVPLVAGGETKRVRDRNKKEFVGLATRRRALGGADSAVSAMRAGLSDVIPKNLLSVLLPTEIAKVVSGPRGDVNLHELKENVWYVDSEFKAGHSVIRWWWKWAEGLDEQSKRRLLLFWSGSSRTPPFGFDDDTLNEDHRWAIDKGPRRDECPQVSTCDRRMTLPVYSSREALTKYMNTTIEYGYVGYTMS